MKNKKTAKTAAVAATPVVPQITTVTADDLLKKNIYDYGIDILEDRVLADFRDGFKPAQRRILWAAKELKAYSDAKTVKSARVTGDCMGKFHPHGSAYGSLVTLATSEYPAMVGQGNFGSITDGPAAERYTETKISEIGMKALECIPVADMVPNYGGDLLEPVVLPTRFPNFFVNDSAGIAVGLSCNIPAHNLAEIVDALKVVLKKGQATTIKDLMKCIKGPDYMYGGKCISTPSEIQALYEHGEGSLKYECTYTLKPEGRNTLLTVTGYCPGFNPNSFIEKMIKLIDTGDIIYANDSSTKNDPCKIEVLMKNATVFDKVYKFLVKTCSYRFYAIKRTKSTNVAKDVDVEVLVPTMINLLNDWIDWRKDIETKMTQRELTLVLEKEQRLRTKESAANNLTVVKDALESDDPEAYVLANLPYLQTLNASNPDAAQKCADYLMEQKLSSVRRLDIVKLQADINDCVTRTNELNVDLSDISQVVLRELNKLSVFYKPRKLIF